MIIVPLDTRYSAGASNSNRSFCICSLLLLQPTTWLPRHRPIIQSIIQFPLATGAFYIALENRWFMRGTQRSNRHRWTCEKGHFKGCWFNLLAFCHRVYSLVNDVTMNNVTVISRICKTCNEMSFNKRHEVCETLDFRVCSCLWLNESVMQNIALYSFL